MDDVSLLIRHRLKELGLEQKHLARAVQVTDSYISQLLGRKKRPPAPARTDLYERIGQFLGLPSGELARLALAQRHRELRSRMLEAPAPLFAGSRELLLRKCDLDRRDEVGRIFAKEPFGELERLVTQQVLAAAQAEGRDAPLGAVAQSSGWTPEQARAAIAAFLETDVLGLGSSSCTAVLDVLLEGWDIDLRTFALELTFFAAAGARRFEFLETPPTPPPEPGFAAFLGDPALRGDATPEELGFLGQLRFAGRKPSALYYYRELQSLRDPLHFPDAK